MTAAADRPAPGPEEKRLDALARAVRNNTQEPKAKAVSRALAELIERGFWRPGEKLPTEKDLTGLLRLSLGTVQTAMRDLTGSGLVDRRRGSGSFVSTSHDYGGTVWHFRFRPPGGGALLPWEADVRSVSVIHAEGAWSRFIAGSSSFIRISRTVRVNNELTLWSEVYVDRDRFRSLLDLPLGVLSTKNLRVFLHESYNAPTFRMVHRIRCRTIDAKHAAAIGCAPNISGLEVSAYGYSYRDSPIMFQRILIPPTELELEILG